MFVLSQPRSAHAENDQTVIIKHIEQPKVGRNQEELAQSSVHWRNVWTVVIIVSMPVVIIMSMPVVIIMSMPVVIVVLRCRAKESFACISDVIYIP